MQFSTRLSWHTLYRSQSAFFGCLAKSPLVRLIEPERHFNRISAKKRILYHPIDIELTNLFHLQMHRSLRRQFNVVGKRFPYQVPIASLEAKCHVSVVMQLFLPDMLSVRVICHDELSLSKDQVFEFRRLDRHPTLVHMTEEAVRIAADALCADVPIREYSHPVLKFFIDSKDDELLTGSQRFFAAAVINDRYYEKSDASIIDRVLADNADHNKKHKASKLILINKQGYGAVTNGNSAHDRTVIQEIKKRERMFELGYALQSFYGTYPALRQKYMREMDYLFFATQPYIRDSKLTFSASYGNSLAWDVVLESLRLKSAFDDARRINVAAEGKLSNLCDRIPSPEYSNPSFWNEVRDKLGEPYMTSSSDRTVNIGTMHGPLTMGDYSPVNAVTIEEPTRAVVLKIVEELAQLRQEVADAAEREKFDELVKAVQSEIKSERPNASNLSRIFNGLKSLAQGITSHVIAIELVQHAMSLLHLAG
jgi:hypothetical protein